MPRHASSDIVLQLDSSTLFGTGLHRACHVHPEDADRCIKIVIRDDDRETRREQAYYARLEERDISWGMLSRYYGGVQTNLGYGSVFELIRDYTGEISKTMDHYLSSPDERDGDVQGLLQAIAMLKEYLIDEKIITMTLKAKNILYQKSGPTDGKLVIVDGVGNSDFLPICDHVAFFAVRKINRRWQRFEASLAKDYGHNEALQRMLSDPDGQALT